MSIRPFLGYLGHLSAVLFLPLRRLFGPLHRRRRRLPPDPAAQDRPALPPPWNTDDRWYRGGFPPRQHNDLRPLIHGQEYFSDLLETLRSARRRVTIAGWCLSPLMALRRGAGEAESSVAQVLHEVSQRAEVYVLLWSGAPALFEPNVHVTRGVRETLVSAAPRVRCQLDTRAAFSHDHHQKAVTVDGWVAYVGGIDLSTFQGDRWDTAQHPLRFGPGWHDAQVRLQGEVVRDVEENFCQRWNAVTGDSLQPLPPPDPDPAWNTPAQIVRTVPAGFYPFAPQGEYGIRHALLAAILKAERLIYLENQYLWAPEVVDALIEAMNRTRSDPFRIVLVLPAHAYTGKYDNDDHVSQLQEADAGRGLFHAYALYSGGAAISLSGYRYLPIYVHAKISIVDDEWFSVGSANLNRRGLATDTEMNVQAVAPSIARSLRVRLWAEHLGTPEEEVAARDAIELVDQEWQTVGTRMAAAVRAGVAPPGGHAFHYTPGRNPGSRALDFLQALTLEH